MKHLLWKLLVALTLLSLAGCAPATVAVQPAASPTAAREIAPTTEPEASPTAQPAVMPAGDVARSDVEREALPAVSDADLAELAAGNSAFAFDLFRRSKRATRATSFTRPTASRSPWP